MTDRQPSTAASCAVLAVVAVCFALVVLGIAGGLVYGLLSLRHVWPW